MYCKKCDVCGAIYDLYKHDMDYGVDLENRTNSELFMHLRGQDTKIDANGEYVIDREVWHLCPECTVKVFDQLQIMKKEADKDATCN